MVTHGDDSQQSSKSAQKKIDWTICVLCQEKKSGEALVCPGKTTRQDTGAGYMSLAQNIKQFDSLGCMPIELDLESMNSSGGGIAHTLTANRACWHEQCYNKFNNLKLQRALKRASVESSTECSTVKTRRKDQNTKDEKCYFCEQAVYSENEDYRKARTVGHEGLDGTVRNCAEDIGDSVLLAKLALGDMHALDAVYHKNCLSALITKANRSRQEKDKTLEEQAIMEEIFYAELI